MWSYSLSILTPQGIPVYSRPFGMANVAQWTPSEGDSANNYILVSEESANNLTYVSTTDYNIVDEYYLQPLRRPPDNTPLTLRVNYKTRSAISVKFTLLDGSTVIKESAEVQTPTAEFTQYSLTIPYSDWSAINNWTNLRIRLTSNVGVESGNEPEPSISIVTNGLVINYDGANGDSYPGTGATWFNAAAAGPNLTISGSTTFDSGGSYFSFGTNQVTDYMSVGPTSSIPADDYTVELWFKSRASSTVQCALHYGLGNGISNNVIGIGLTTPTQLYFDVFGTEYTFNIASGNANKWLCVAKTRTKSSGVEDVYLNGQFLGTLTNNAGVSVFTGGYLVLGQEVDGHSGNFAATFDSNQNLDGEIAAVRFYNRVLSSTEITQNYDSAKARYPV